MAHIGQFGDKLVRVGYLRRVHNLLAAVVLAARDVLQYCTTKQHRLLAHHTWNKPALIPKLCYVYLYYIYLLYNYNSNI